MRSIDLTKQFLAYREAARLVWNTFLKDATDAEDFFPAIDKALFNAIIEARVDRDFVRQALSHQYVGTTWIANRGPRQKLR